MINLRNKISLANTFFMLGWSLYLVSYIIFRQTEVMYLYNSSTIYQISKYLVIIIFLTKMIFIDKYSWKKLLCYFTILIIAFANAMNIDNHTLFFTILIALSADQVDFEKFIKKDIKIRILLLIIVIALSLTGILPNFVRFINGHLKQGFGFLHPNFLCFFAITILLEVLYINKKTNFKFLLFNILALYLLTAYCFSRTSILSFVIVFVIDIILKNKEKFFENIFVKTIVCLLPLLLTIISLMCVIWYGNGNNTVIKIDKIFTERISAGYIFYSDYGINMFGNEIKTIGTREALFTGQKTNIFDMGYFRLLVGYGLIMTITIVSLLCLLQKAIINKKDYKLLLISIFFIITGFAENSIYNIIMNFTLICIPYIFIKKKESSKTSNEEKLNESQNKLYL